VSFLLAHLAYLVAFTQVERFAARPPVFVAYGVVAAIILALLWPGVPAGLRVPVVAYVLCLASMAAQAAVLWRAGAARGGVLALGGALFLVSDALLATNKFAAALPLASLWVLATYWTAQWCIASWLRPGRCRGAFDGVSRRWRPRRRGRLGVVERQRPRLRPVNGRRPADSTATPVERRKVAYFSPLQTRAGPRAGPSRWRLNSHAPASLFQGTTRPIAALAHGDDVAHQVPRGLRHPPCAAWGGRTPGDCR
jgi:hypothetical protein